MSAERAATGPRGGQLGKEAVWATLAAAAASGQLADTVCVDLTSGELLKWWLWLPNLGRHGHDVIGTGVWRCSVRRENADHYDFDFERPDGTSGRLHLMREWSRGSTQGAIVVQAC